MASHTRTPDPAAPASLRAPPVVSLAGSSLLALTRDARLVATLKRVSDPVHEVRVAGSEVDLGTALLAHRFGVVLLDAAAVVTPIGNLAARLQAQFPEVVLLITGSAEDQGALSAQITEGSVHRFLHKPVSEQRLRLFVESAWRRHADSQSGTHHALITPERGRGRGVKLLLLAATLAALACVAWFNLRPLLPYLRTATAPASAAAAAARAAAPAAADAALESLLARADHALAAGDLLTPPGASAAALYHEALERNARDPRALNGLEQVIDRLLADAEAQLQARHLDDAQRLAEQARSIKPDHPRVAFLLAQIGAQRERSVLDKAQRAAASGNVAGALAVLDDATRGGHRSTVVTEAREQLAQQQVDSRLEELLRRGRDSLARGQLIEPPEQNSRFFVASALALAPGDARVQQAVTELLARVKAAAATAAAAGNVEQADLLASAASDLGASGAEVTQLRAQARERRNAAKSASLAQLSLAFNESLANGRLVEPASDSARFYLSQLTQMDAADHATQQARSAFEARLLDEARSTLRAQDFPGTRRWLDEARAAGADASGITALETALSAAQETAAAATQYVSASSLTRTHYLAPQFPEAARQRGIEGWVDLQFLVNTDGSVGELTVMGAQPVGVFEQAALEAVRRWHYQPVVRAGQTVSQRARVRVRFAMQP